MLPEGWELKSLGSFCKFSQGFQIGVENHLDFSNENTVRFIRIVDYTKDNEPPRFIEKNPNHYIVSVDDLVMMRYGDAGFLSRGIEGVIANNMFLINPDLGIATKEFLYEVLKSKYKIISAMAASSAMPAIKFTDIKPFNVLLPPLPEQKKIAQILSTWDNAISATERLLENSQQRKKALMQQLLTGKKRLPGFEGEFKCHDLSELLEIDHKSLASKTDPDFEFHYISLSDVSGGKISPFLEKHKFKSSPSRARRIVTTGDILLATVRPNLQGFALIKEKHKGCIASTGFAVLSPKKGACGDYIYNYLFSSHITNQIEALVVGTNYPAINSSDVAALRIYSPSYEEQLAIANVLTTADQEIDALQKRLDHIKLEKKALMQQLLTGKRRVQVGAAA